MVIKHGQIDKPMDNRNYKLKVALISDIHVGYDSWGNYDKLNNIFKHISNSDVDFVISMGDELDSGYARTPELMAEQLAQLNTSLQYLDKPLFKVKGNHDDSVNTFTEFGTIICNGVKFICIWPKYIGMTADEIDGSSQYSSRGELTTDDIAWIESELESCGSNIPIIISHYAVHTRQKVSGKTFIWPICDTVTDMNGNTHDGHRDELLALCSTYSVPLFLNGHEHRSGLIHDTVDDLDMENVQIASLTSHYVEMTVYDTGFQLKEMNTTDFTQTATLTLGTIPS